MAELSAGAKRILKHFQDKKSGQGDYEYPASLEALFDNIEDCERAQAELARAGLIDTVPAQNQFAKSKVVGAALNLDGVRYLQKNPVG